jgi:hypothetical protein
MSSWERCWRNNFLAQYFDCAIEGIRSLSCFDHGYLARSRVRQATEPAPFENYISLLLIARQTNRLTRCECWRCLGNRTVDSRIELLRKVMQRLVESVYRAQLIA